MESSPIKELKFKNKKINYLYDSNRKSSFNYIRNKKIVLQKRSRSMFYINTNKLIKKYSFRLKSNNSVQSNANKKRKTSLIKPEKKKQYNNKK